MGLLDKIRKSTGGGDDDDFDDIDDIDNDDDEDQDSEDSDDAEEGGAGLKIGILGKVFSGKRSIGSKGKKSDEDDDDDDVDNDDADSEEFDDEAPPVRAKKMAKKPDKPQNMSPKVAASHARRSRR